MARLGVSLPTPLFSVAFSCEYVEATVVLLLLRLFEFFFYRIFCEGTIVACARLEGRSNP